MTLVRKYYTLAEAAEAAGLSVGDIEHYLETGQLKPKLYASDRAFLVFSRDEERKQWDAHGQCRYQGLLSVHKSWIDNLWAHGEIVLNKLAEPIEPENITNHVTGYPFKTPHPDLPYTSWRPQGLDQLDLANIRLLPMPEEQPSLKAQFQPLIKVLNHAAQKTTEPLSEQQKYTYGFKTNGRFQTADLRFDRETIVLLRAGSVTNSVTPPEQLSPPSRDDGSLPWSDSKKGGALINEVLERLYRANPGQRAKEYWRALRENHEAFDPDKVIDEVTSGEVHWFTRHDKPRIISYKTFENRITEIRRFYSSGAPNRDI